MSELKASIARDGTVTVTESGKTKNIALSDYLSVLQTLVNAESVTSDYIRTPKGMHSMSRTPKGYVVNLYYPECPRKLSFAGKGSATIHVPNVMIRVVLSEVAGNKGSFSMSSIKWYCTDKSDTELGTEWPTGRSEEDHVWTLPFPNMWENSGMCTGGNRIPSVIYYDWTVLDSLYEDVLMSQFNNHLSINCMPNHTSPEGWWEFMKDHYKNKENKTFPYHLLSNY